jgi:hypothetical protein
VLIAIVGAVYFVQRKRSGEEQAILEAKRADLARRVEMRTGKPHDHHVRDYRAIEVARKLNEKAAGNA